MEINVKNHIDTMIRMTIREYKSDDCKEITELFYNTVHTVNARDYFQEQLDVWAPEKPDMEKWSKSLAKNYCVVALDKKTIIGFGDIDDTGYLDRLFVHKDYQRKGVATAICEELENYSHKKITTHASFTAKPFFDKRGYCVIKEQQVERNGIFLTNFVMEKIFNT